MAFQLFEDIVLSDHSTPFDPVKIGILGCANIARQFIRDVRSSPLVRVDAVASRRGEVARAFASENGVARSFPSYDAMLADPMIDAIYLPLPNSMHAEWAIKTAHARKHVLCEKPLALNRREAESMLEAAQRNGTVLIEAYPYWFQPQMQALRELSASGAIGAVRGAR